jgi:hypothetical protein
LGFAVVAHFVAHLAAFFFVFFQYPHEQYGKYTTERGNGSEFCKGGG